MFLVDELYAAVAERFPRVRGDVPLPILGVDSPPVVFPACARMFRQKGLHYA